MKFVGVIVAALGVLGCGDTSFTSVPLDHFHVQDGVLEEGAQIEVLTFSGMPDQNKEASYYIHMLIKSVETGDTLNLLTFNPGTLLANQNRQFLYLSEKSTLYQHMLAQFNVNGTPMDEVHLDKAFIPDIQNDYPAVIGILGRKVNTEN